MKLKPAKLKTAGIAMSAFAALATGSHAALLLYEPFNIGAGAYTAGSLNGQNPTVAGFSGAWTSSGFAEWGSGNAQVITTGLNYSGLSTSGGAYSSDGITLRLIDAVNFSDPNLSGTYYMSFLMKYNTTPTQAGWKMLEFTRADKTRAAWLGTSQYSHPGDFSFNDQGVISSPNNNDVNLFVLKMQFNAGGNDTFTIWMNPDLGTEPLTGGQTSSGNYAFAYLGIMEAASGGSGGVTWDELRIGTTYASVIPEPSAALFGAFGLLALLRRRRS